MIVPSREAIEYGRSVVGRLVEKYETFERKARDKDDEAQALRWRRHVNLLRHDLYGWDDGGCVIVAFDQRWLDDNFRTVMEQVRTACDAPARQKLISQQPRESES